MSESAAPGRIVRDESGRVVVGDHAAVVAVAQDPTTFSSAVSRHLQVPNGLDGDAHAEARRLLDPFFDDAEVEALTPSLERIAAEIVAALGDRPFDAVTDLGARFAVRAQSAWLGWRPELEEELLGWVEDNRSATRSGDPERTSEVARRFDAIIRRILDRRRARPVDDVTTRLLGLHWEDGDPLEDAELVSVLRNWTAGDLSSIALCTGVLVHWLAANPRHRAHLVDADGPALDAAIDEILRADDPFVSNRRVAVRDTVIDGCPVAAGDTVVLDWRLANRDPAVFADPDAFDPVGNAAANLVYGTGPHVCPGRPLATRELRVVVRAVLAGAPSSSSRAPRPSANCRRWPATGRCRSGFSRRRASRRSRRRRRASGRRARWRTPPRRSRAPAGWSP
ncbi:cytochrome P450 [Agromyces marinus]|nr:cytochrome P450 [Agromyces marinus]